MRQKRAHRAASMKPVQLILKVLIVAASLHTVSVALAETVVVSNERSGDLTFIDRDGNTTEVIELCARPRGMSQSRADKLLFIACSDDNKIVVFDPVTRQKKKEFLNIKGAMSIAIHEPSNRLLISNEGNAQATVLDSDSGKVLARLATGHEPDGVVFTDDGKLIFVASENAGLVHVFDGKTYKPITRILTQLRPRRMALRANELWVSSEMGSRVEIFETAGFEKTDEIVFAPRGFRSEQLTPVDILFDETGNTAFVALGSANHVVIIDAASREIKKYILVGRRPWGLALSPNGERLFVLNGLSDDMTMIDIVKQRPIRTMRTGLVPHSVEVLH